MKISPKQIKRGATLFLIVSGALLFNQWRHPSLPQEVALPQGARLSYSVRFVNATMSGPALYYRIESPQTQHVIADFFQSSPIFIGAKIQTFPGSAPATQRDFKSVSLLGSAGDKMLVLSSNAQVFPVESESLCECRIWKTSSGSTAELLVWTNF